MDMVCVLRLLFEHDCELNVTNELNESLFDFAKRCRAKKCFQILKEAARYIELKAEVKKKLEHENTLAGGKIDPGVENLRADSHCTNRPALKGNSENVVIAERDRLRALFNLNFYTILALIGALSSFAYFIHYY